MAETTIQADEQPKDVLVKVTGDRPVNGVYKDGTLLMHPEIAKQFEEAELVEIMPDEAKDEPTPKTSGKTAGLTTTKPASSDPV